MWSHTYTHTMRQGEAYDMGNLVLTITLEDGHADNLGDTISISQTDSQGVLNVVIITRSDIHRIQSMVLGVPGGVVESHVDTLATQGAKT